MIVIFFILLIHISITDAWDGICPSDALESTTSKVCYTFSSTTATFSQAQFQSNAAKHGWPDFWIGAALTKVYNDAGVVKIWTWEGLEKLMKYDNWGFNEPSNKDACAAVKTSDSTWFVENCTQPKHYVCSIPVKVDVCDDQWTYFSVTKSCYKVYFHSDWITAENNCVAQGAHLVSVHNKQEDLFIQDLSHCGQQIGDASKGTIIGLYTTTNDNGKWQWSDGSTTDYVPWGKYEPNYPGEEKCGSIYTDPTSDGPAGYWNNMGCGRQLRNFVCKKNPDQVNIK
uniref:C-type lectin domain-containing protein n=1 Tax=Panagrolaimus sp. JU765 TaxID=591449 RepID=A0AC34RNV1_9BILA